ncbi:MAG: amidohydrolase [Proteocatella sp.]
MENSILLYNGNFESFGPKRNSWAAVTNGVIIDTGDDEGYRKYLNVYKEVIDLQKKLVLPGFFDCHAHFVQTAIKGISLNLNGCRNYQEIGKRIDQWVKKHPKTSIIRAFGLGISDLEEGEFPTRKLLDKYTKDHAIWINSRDFHCSMLNTRAFHELKIPLIMEGVEYDEKGNPTGRVYGKVNALTRKKIFQSYSTSEKHDAIIELSEKIIKKGVTSIHIMEGGYEFYENDAQDMQRYKDQLMPDINLFYSTMDFKKIQNMKMDRIGGDVYIDGSFASKTAAIDKPYRGEEHNGELYFTQDEINEFILKSYEQRLNTSLHAVGERALEQILCAHEHASGKFPDSNLRHRVEHVELSSQAQRARAKKIGLIFSMQPAYEYFYGGKGGMYEDRLGERYKETNQYRKIIDEGIIICGGSDSDLTPIDPILGIHSAVNHPVKENRVSVEEAVKFFTINAAYSVREESKKGTIEIGKMADLVILDKDIFRINPEEIITAQVAATVKNGCILYKNF